MQLNAEFRDIGLDDQQVEDELLTTNDGDSIVFIGAGLASIWQDEEKPEWRLLQNILNTFQLAIENAVCFDSNLLQTEDSIQLTIEEIIELGCENVFSFDESSELVEQLQEGLQVTLIPSLSEQLTRWQSKKTCFETMNSL